MGGVEIAKYTFFEKISRIFWSIQKKAVLLQPISRVSADALTLLIKLKFTKQW